jgi:hypothetical protein
VQQRLMSGHVKPIAGHGKFCRAKVVHSLGRRRAPPNRIKICCEDKKWSSPGWGLAPIGSPREGPGANL